MILIIGNVTVKDSSEDKISDLIFANKVVKHSSQMQLF